MNVKRTKRTMCYQSGNVGVEVLYGLNEFEDLGHFLDISEPPGTSEGFSPECLTPERAADLAACLQAFADDYA